MWETSNKWEECVAEHSNKPSETFTIYKLGVNCHKWEADPKRQSLELVKLFVKLALSTKHMNREVNL